MSPGKQICKYVIKSEGGSKSGNPITYEYGRTQITMNLSSQGFYISYERPEVENLLKENIVRDAIRKAELLYALKYSKTLSYSRIDALINEEDVCLLDTDGGDAPLTYTMYTGRLRSPMAKAWRTKGVLESIANTAKSNYDRRHAALFALIMAKSKMYETEKFMYLWMSMNAMYGYLASIRGGKGLNESQQMTLIASIYSAKYAGGLKENRDKIRGATMGFLEKLTSDELTELLVAIHKNNWNEEVLQEVKVILDELFGAKKIDPLAFFLLWLPYQIRCKYFHGEKAIPMISFSDERPLTVLKFVNGMLESFLDNELVRWFDEDNLDKEIIPKAKTAIIN